ncbi:MAG: hypothetical protein ACLR0U_08565 [Enterocloster clostridioformis]
MAGARRESPSLQGGKNPRQNPGEHGRCHLANQVPVYSQAYGDLAA